MEIAEIVPLASPPGPRYVAICCQFSTAVEIQVITVRCGAAASAPPSKRCAIILAVVGVVNLPIIKYSVEWWYTLHQPASFSLTEKPAMPTEMWLPLLVMVIAYYLFFFTVWFARLRNEILDREREADWVKSWVMFR